MTLQEDARTQLKAWRGDSYVHGLGVLPTLGRRARELGRRAAFVSSSFPGSAELTAALRASLIEAGCQVVGQAEGAAPNAPRQDVERLRSWLEAVDPDVVVSFGGGSTIDAVKAAEVLRTLGGDIERYFGTGLVSEALTEAGKRLLPHLAIQTAASSGAHLTKYSNVTDLSTGQKKLVVDDAIVPTRAGFDYAVTREAPASLTCDGALDGLSHVLEVLYGAVGKPHYEKAAAIARTALPLVVGSLPVALAEPGDLGAREALGLATDLGAHAIMIGGTNGAHLTSFSLVDVLSHGRACGMLNPYYTVFFAPAIEQPLRLVGAVFAEAGLAEPGLDHRRGRDLGLAVARAMIAFEAAVGLPTRLADVPGFTDGHVARALAAAKNPQLRMKLENMPVPLTAEGVDDFMGPVLEAARTGRLELVRNVGA